MQRDFKRRSEQINPTPQQRLQRRAENPDATAQKTARADQHAARQTNFAGFIQRFATTPEAELATQILSGHAPSAEQRTAARALPAVQRVRLQRLLQSQHVTGSLSLGREALNPVQRASDHTVADLTGLPVPAAAIPTQSLETRLQHHRAAKASLQPAALEPSAAPRSTQLERQNTPLEGRSPDLGVQRADDGQNQLSHSSPNLSRNVQRSPAHSDAVSEHISTAQTARVQRQRAVNARAGELKAQMLSTQVQRLRAPDAPSLEGSGKAYTLSGQADRINTDLPIMRAKHNHDPAYLDGDTKPVTDFARHVGLSLGRQYHVQRTRNGARPRDLSAVISRVHDAHDRANLLTSTLTTFNPNDREAASVQRLVAERETELGLQRQALETDLKPVTQRLAEREAEHPENLSAMIARAGASEELPEKVKRQLQPQFNFSLDIVRVHRDGYADKLAKTVNAVAFTTGVNIFFRSGKFDPSSGSGRGLLVHELTHVGQQLEGRAKAGVDADQGLEDQAASAGVKEEGKGALPEAAARDAVESQGLSGVADVAAKSVQRSGSSGFGMVSVQRLEDKPNAANPLSITGTIPVGKISGVAVTFEYKISAKLPSENGIADTGLGYTEGGIKLSTAKIPSASKVKGVLARVKESLFAELKTSGLKVIFDKALVLDGKKMFLEVKLLELSTSGGSKENESSLNLVSVAGKLEDSKEIAPSLLTVEISAKLPVTALVSLSNEAGVVDDLTDYLAKRVEGLSSQQLDLLDEAEKVAKELKKIESEIEKTTSASRTTRFVSRTSKTLRRNATRFAGESSKKIAGLIEKSKLLERSRALLLEKFLENQASLNRLKVSFEELVKTQKPALQKLFVRAAETKLGQIVARLAPRALLTLGKVLSVVGWVLLIADLVQAANGLLLWLAGHRKFKFLAGDGSVGYFDFITESFEPEKHKFKEGDSDEPSGEQTGNAPNGHSETDANSGANNTTQKDHDSSSQGSPEQPSQPRAEQVLQDKSQLKLLSFMTARTGDNKLTSNQYIQLLSIIGAYELDEKTLETVIQQLSSGTLSSPEQAISALQQILARFGVPKTTAGQESQTSASGSSEKTLSSTVSSGNVSDETKSERKKPRVKKKISGQGMGGAPTKQRISSDASSQLIPYSGEVSSEKTNIVSSLVSYTTNKQGTIAIGKCVLVLYNSESNSRLRLKARVIEVHPNYVRVQTEITTQMIWEKGAKTIAILQPKKYGVLTLKRT